MSSFHDVAATPPPSPALATRDAAGATSPFLPHRNLTPSRMLVAPVRQGSAERGLAFRSNSAGRALTKQSERSTELAKAVYEAQSCNRAMSTSRRKQRQWENNNCLDMYLSRRKNRKNQDEEGGEEEEEEEEGASRFMLRVDWRSTFSKLFAKENVDALELIRKCAESGDNTKCRSVVQQHSKRRMLSVGAAEWRDAEVAWLNVEKRLRGVVAPALKKSVELSDFVLALQVVLSFFSDTQTAPPVAFVPIALSRYLRAPLELSKSTSSSAPPSLVVSLVDSSFHRLLLHATCQFYGFRSRSMEASSTQQKQRSTHCSLPKSGPSVVMKSQTSLVAFLHFAEDAVSERE